MWSIQYIIHFRITQSLSKVVIQRVQNCTNIPGNKGIGYMFETKCSSLHHQSRKIDPCYNKQKWNKKLSFPIFDNEFSSSSKQLKTGPKYCFFQSNTRKCEVTIPSVLHLVVWCLTTSLWIYSWRQNRKKWIMW